MRTANAFTSSHTVLYSSFASTAFIDDLYAPVVLCGVVWCGVVWCRVKQVRDALDEIECDKVNENMVRCF